VENLIGPKGQMYAEHIPDPDGITFTVNNTDAAYFNSPYFNLHMNLVVPVPDPRPGVPLNMNLSDFVGDQIISDITTAGCISFHSVGDTGLVNLVDGLNPEASVTEAMASEVLNGGPNPPAFLFHLGDVVYYFGESQYYYEQFYEPFRNYNRPIFAIPGNHDSSIEIQSDTNPLQPFLNNFCAEVAAPSPDAGRLTRTTMTQPGVYFTLDAPFVSIIGLWTNCLDHFGIISTQNGTYPAITDQQLGFLTSELKRLAADRNAGKRALILAIHAPAYSFGGEHAGADGMVKDIDACCQAAGLYPDMVLSGHVHLYQRFTRTLGTGQEIPYITCGSGGFKIQKCLPILAKAGTTVGDCTIAVDPIMKFGYLTLTTDAKTLTASFRNPATNGTQELDSVTVDLISKKILTKPNPQS
jgi:hypothetical protein